MTICNEIYKILKDPLLLQIKRDQTYGKIQNTVYNLKLYAIFMFLYQ